MASGYTSRYGVQKNEQMDGTAQDGNEWKSSVKAVSCMNF